MRIVLFVTTVVLGSAGLSMKAEAVCNMRGQFCSYPAWAANAFTSPEARVPDFVLEDRARWWNPTDDNPYRGKRIRHARQR